VAKVVPVKRGEKIAVGEFQDGWHGHAPLRDHATRSMATA